MSHAHNAHLSFFEIENKRRFDLGVKSLVSKYSRATYIVFFMISAH